MKSENRYKARPKKHDELEVTSGWRVVLSFKTGTPKRAKRRMNRRTRRELRKKMDDIMRNM